MQKVKSEKERSSDLDFAFGFGVFLGLSLLMLMIGGLHLSQLKAFAVHLGFFFALALLLEGMFVTAFFGGLVAVRRITIGTDIWIRFERKQAMQLGFVSGFVASASAAVLFYIAYLLANIDPYENVPYYITCGVLMVASPLLVWPLLKMSTSASAPDEGETIRVRWRHLIATAFILSIILCGMIVFSLRRFPLRGL